MNKEDFITLLGDRFEEIEYSEYIKLDTEDRTIYTTGTETYYFKIRNKLSQEIQDKINQSERNIMVLVKKHIDDFNFYDIINPVIKNIYEDTIKMYITETVKVEINKFKEKRNKEVYLKIETLEKELSSLRIQIDNKTMLVKK